MAGNLPRSFNPWLTINCRWSDVLNPHRPGALACANHHRPCPATGARSAWPAAARAACSWRVRNCLVGRRCFRGNGNRCCQGPGPGADSDFIAAICQRQHGQRRWGEPRLVRSTQYGLFLAGRPGPSPWRWRAWQKRKALTSLLTPGFLASWAFCSPTGVATSPAYETRNPARGDSDRIGMFIAFSVIVLPRGERDFQIALYAGPCWPGLAMSYGGLIVFPDLAHSWL